jgi:hypothetical protein
MNWVIPQLFSKFNSLLRKKLRLIIFEMYLLEKNNTHIIWCNKKVDSTNVKCQKNWCFIYKKNASELRKTKIF